MGFSSSNHFFFLFLFIALLFCSVPQVNARDGNQLFNKVARHVTQDVIGQPSSVTRSDSVQEFGYGLYGGDERPTAEQQLVGRNGWSETRYDEQQKRQGMSDNSVSDERYEFDSMEEYEKYQENRGYYSP